MSLLVHVLLFVMCFQDLFLVERFKQSGRSDFFETFDPQTALLELLGREEFERIVCPLDVARDRWRVWRNRHHQYNERQQDNAC